MINGQRDWSPVYPVRKSMAPSTGRASKVVKTTLRRLDNEYLGAGSDVTVTVGKNEARDPGYNGKNGRKSMEIDGFNGFDFPFTLW